ncbi:type I secretion system permease/ATPase [Chelativorans sp. AA-79]|uniref:type I secretion system permease/ATPase n=1 Tax=Chelativorans sp. AA-79 TaxID=3028735 RepID=UPI0023F8376C|nr:type I secretion system permease/ATPase [Chelativorans sp. AA-79]WEX10467.1 type I secretion system permease/ATPase [Chelativorans sp. AA-79]
MSESSLSPNPTRKWQEHGGFSRPPTAGDGFSAGHDRLSHPLSPERERLERTNALIDRMVREVFSTVEKERAAAQAGTAPRVSRTRERGNAQEQAVRRDPDAPRREEPAPQNRRQETAESSASRQQDVLVEEKPKAEFRGAGRPEGMVSIDGDRRPIEARKQAPDSPAARDGGGPGTATPAGGGDGVFHKRLGPIDFAACLKAGLTAVRRNLAIVMVFTVASNVLVLAIPVYLFQISDRILTSRSLDTLVMLTVVIVGAVIMQAAFDAIRRFILMRTAVEFAAQLGSPILSAAARASLYSNGREYQTLGDLQQVRTFLVSRTLLAFLDAPIAPLFVLAVFLIHPHLGFIVVLTGLLLLAFTLLNQRATAKPFSEANTAQVKANLHLESMSRNSQIINALAMIPEAVQIWGKDTAGSLKAQVIAQDRNIVFAALSKGSRLLTQVGMLGWGAYLAIEGEITGGMVIAASIIAGRALAPIEGAIEGWNQYSQSRSSYERIAALLKSSPLNLERLNLPRPEGRLDVERLLYVPQGTKRVVLNGISFALAPGDSLAVIGNSGAGKTTLGKMLVGSILPTSGSVRLDLMDLRNWDQRQFGENIGYLPQDVQLFPGTIKANIARMREDATDAQIYEAAKLADVHEMIANLPHGYETVVAADGSPLSGGQKQRIALARAFFGGPRLVVLDEPNSNLDSAGDAALLKALQHARENRITVITITQRPALLDSVDKILLLVNGTVALFGKRQDVLQALAQRGVTIESGAFGHQQIQ